MFQNRLCHNVHNFPFTAEFLPLNRIIPSSSCSTREYISINSKPIFQFNTVDKPKEACNPLFKQFKDYVFSSRELPPFTANDISCIEPHPISITPTYRQVFQHRTESEPASTWPWLLWNKRNHVHSWESILQHFAYRVFF